ncbi:MULTISPECIES: phosphate-starvation-inducible PsiE family protein [Thermococcus]|uniref:Phosphate-starvation-inducible E-like protein n=1 Tax=Thermococcus barossii TaxID=54077 RepID=A0A2Z2MMD8_9EURY|nr:MULTISPECIES: phosphate-starvation-inducible PsiE family protein [Thermococcus]ASJ04984.1 hypothetical protein A3L01_06245 [Thermococcus barossii]NJE77061.1 hypothetical protein [Thermococcus sp. ES12]
MSRKPTIVESVVMGWLSALFDLVVIALGTLTMGYVIYLIWNLLETSLQGFDVEVVLHEIVLIIIFLEIFELLVMYVKEHHVSMRNVVELGVLAMVRKIVITLDYSKIPWTTLIGMAALILAMGWIYVQERRRITSHEEFLIEKGRK